jgi:hypothetical protein
MNSKLFLIVAFLFHSLALPVAEARPVDEVSNLVKQVKRDKDDVDVGVFHRISSVGTPQSVDALKRCTLMVRKQNVIDSAVEAFSAYRGDAKLEPLAVEALGELCFDSSQPYRGTKALRSLSTWGAAADPALEHVVREHNNAETRSTACRRVALRWAASKNPELVKLMIENLSLMPPPSRFVGGRLVEGEKGVSIPDLVKALMESTPEITPVLLKGALNRKTDRSWRLVLLEAMVVDDAPKVTEALGKLTKDSDSVLSLDALHALGKRKDAKELIKVIAGNIKSKHAAQRRAAVVALGKLSIEDEGWQDQLFKLALKKDAAVRMGACHALADLRTPEAVMQLERLLQDKQWPVRAEAMWQLTSLRKKTTIPLLIERLSRESARLCEDVAKALRILTEKDLGTAPVRWEAWWAAEGAAFEVGPLDGGLAAERARERGAAAGETSASFFGLRILSDRVCFILDTSGSMNEPSKGDGERTGSGGEGGSGTRMTAAKRQLVQALEKFPEGERFNMIFFSHSAESWKKGLTPMSTTNRSKSIEAARDLRADGGTAVYDALKLAFDDVNVDTIYLLTDGEPTAGEVIEPDRIRRQVGAWNETRLITIHTISVGRDSPLLRDLAEDSGGRYKRID